MYDLQKLLETENVWLTLQNMADHEEEWLEHSVQERRAVLQEFHNKVEELAVNSPYDTDAGMVHHFGDGTYGREATVHAGVAIVGAVYEKPQINVLLEGVVFVATEHTIRVMRAPCVFVSEPNTRKVGFVLETMRWITVMSREYEQTDTTEILNKHTTQEDTWQVS